MSLHDGIRAGGKHSYKDFGLEIASREIGLPEKKSIRKTVPFMTGFYDFTTLNGAPAWGERQIKYAFDIIGATVEEMDAERTEVVNWLCNLHEVDIFDDSIPNYHFRGSYDSYSLSEDGEHVELTVVFVCYPFMLSNSPSVFTVYESKSVTIVNGGRPASPVVSSAQAAIIASGGQQKSVPPVSNYRVGMMLASGDNVVTVTKQNEVKYPYANTTIRNNGIEFADNGDGTVTASGTATDVAWFWMIDSAAKFKLPIGKHRVTGCPVNAGASDYRIQCYVYNGSSADSKYYYDSGSGVVIDVTEKTEYISMAIRFAKGSTASNLIFSPEMYGETKITFAGEVL